MTAPNGSSATTLAAGGTATITATHKVDADAEGSADAAGSGVAVGADIGINVVVGWTTTAELARNLDATSLDIQATSEANDSSQAKASAKGSSNSGDNADTQANNQVKNNANASGAGVGTLPSASGGADGSNGLSSANSSSSGQSGDSGGGVGVAAAIAVNWLDATNTAEIDPNVTVVVTGGSVIVQGSTHTTGYARAIGLAVNLSGGPSLTELVAGGVWFLDVRAPPPDDTWKSTTASRSLTPPRGCANIAVQADVAARFRLRRLGIAADDDEADADVSAARSPSRF